MSGSPGDVFELGSCIKPDCQTFKPFYVWGLAEGKELKTNTLGRTFDRAQRCTLLAVQLPIQKRVLLEC